MTKSLVHKAAAYSRLWLLCWSLALPCLAWGQQYSISGHVWDSLNTPLAGATATVEGTGVVAIADNAGFFELKINKLKEQKEIWIRLEHVGYIPFSRHAWLGSETEIALGVTILQESPVMLQEVSVRAILSDINTPMAANNINKKDIQKMNVGVDMPYILDLTPSVVVTSDAGAGVGYTGIRVRGSDPTRVNITINGIPYNDSESQGTFWVNMPDFASSVNKIQIQRGVGTSTNGASAFGATVALQTNAFNWRPFGEIANSYGSFGSRKHSISFGSGLIKDHFYVEGRLSHILSDGYVDRASSNLKSFYISTGFVNAKTSIRANIFSGKELTYQAWGGAPVQLVQDTGKTFGYLGKPNKIADSLRRYNPYTYDNEVDDYAQTHYQLHFNQELLDTVSTNTSHRLMFNASLHYTKGKGFYEQYRWDDALADYGMADILLSDSSTISSTDLIRRRWLDNDFYGIVYALNYSGWADITVGGGWNRYIGRHFGEVIWARYASDSEIRHRYYDNKAIKWDGNTYLKFQKQITEGLYAFADLQHRYVYYSFLGNMYNAQGDIEPMQLDTVFNFFNPKVGLSYRVKKHRAYASFAMANREPNREDYTNAIKGQFPKPEQLYDVEIGYEFAMSWLQIGLNLYYMHYRNQLVLTGELNDVGAYMRTNVPNSYRMGAELQAFMRPAKWISIMGNFTLSRNKITQWTEYVDNWDTWAQETVEHKNTDIAFSPSMIGASEITFYPLNIEYSDKKKWGCQLEIAWLRKMVGKQYMDNTQSNERALAMYWLHDFRLTCRFQHKILSEIELSFWLKNAFNARYSSNAWVYRFRSDAYNPTPDDPYTAADGNNAGYYNMIGLYPQAGRHFWISLAVRI